MMNNETMHLYLNKDQYNALYALLDAVAVSEETDHGNVQFHGAVSVQKLMDLCSIGSQIFHNETMKENLTKNLRLDKRCNGCVFMIRRRVTESYKYYCTKARSKNKSYNGYKVVYAKDAACEKYEPKYMFG